MSSAIRGKHSAADVVAKAQAVLSEPEILRTKFDVGYFPPNARPTHGYRLGLAGCPLTSLYVLP